MGLEQQMKRVEILPSQPISSTGVATLSDYEACRRIMRSASKNYSFASNFFPEDKLRHVEALYALMRVGDDRVDVSHSGFETAGEAISEWEEAYWSAFEKGDSPHPVLRAYLNTAIEYQIPKDTMAPYFRAMKDDLSVTRFTTFKDLLFYMEGSAIPVGRAMTHILGVRAPYGIADALPGADSLSIAMQLSNFWRDVGYDWRIHRVYLPLEDMDRFGYSETELSEGKVTSSFIQLMEFEFGRTETYYQKARSSVCMLASGRWGVMSGLEIYRAILPSIRRNGYDVFHQKSSPNGAQKIGFALKSLVWDLSQG